MVADETSLVSYRAMVAALLAKCFAHWIVRDPEEFAEKVVRMPGPHGSTVAFSFNYFPPQRQMYRELFNPANREVVYKVASRLTKTTTVLAAIGFWIKEQPRKILVNWPKIGDAEEWSKNHLMSELADTTPEIGEIIGDGRGRRLSNQTILSKAFPGGYLKMFGSNVPGDYRRAKGNVLYAEEIDAIQESETDEGDQLRQFAVRGSEYPDTIGIYSSFPSLKGKSRIDSKYQASDQRRWLSTCLKCGGEPYVMLRGQLRYDSEQPEGAMMECPRCHEFLSDDQRYAMMMGGDPKKPDFDLWEANAPYKGVAGFHANAMLWPHPVDRQKYPGGFLQMLAQEEIDAANSDNPDRAKRVIVNTRDAEPYEPEHIDKVEHTDLYLRREEYDPRELLPDEITVATFGADLQGDRAEIKFKGFGLKDGKNQSWALEYRIVRGSPLQQELWERLENLFRNIAWKRSDGTHLTFAFGLFDCGYKPDYVYAFCRKMRGMGLRIYPCSGATTLARPIVGKPTKRGNPAIPVYEIGTHEAKDVIYQRLEYTDTEKLGYMHFPKTAHFNETYFKQLTIEESEMARGKDGKFYRQFWCPENERNEPLDCEVYADAAERVIRPNYARLAENLKAAVDLEKNPPQQENKPAPVIQRGGLGSGWSL